MSLSLLLCALMFWGQHHVPLWFHAFYFLSPICLLRCRPLIVSATHAENRVAWSRDVCDSCCFRWTWIKNCQHQELVQPPTCTHTLRWIPNSCCAFFLFSDVRVNWILVRSSNVMGKPTGTNHSKGFQQNSACTQGSPKAMGHNFYNVFAKWIVSGFHQHFCPTFAQGPRQELLTRISKKIHQDFWKIMLGHEWNFRTDVCNMLSERSLQKIARFLMGRSRRDLCVIICKSLWEDGAETLGAHFVRGPEVEMHMDMSQQAFETEIDGENAVPEALAQRFVRVYAVDMSQESD